MTIYALGWSGGKDSTLALDRAVRQGLDVRFLFNIYEGSTGRVRFHGVRRELIAAQAASLGRELVQDHTHPHDFETIFDRTLVGLRARGVGGIIFGNIHLADVRAWYEERVTALELEHLEPLWGEEPDALVAELLERGYRTRIAAVDLERGDRDWPGRELDAALAAEIGGRPDTDPAGEHGEYHTFVFDGPLFEHPLAVSVGEVVEMEGHRLVELEL